MVGIVEVVGRQKEVLSELVLAATESYWGGHLRRREVWVHRRPAHGLGRGVFLSVLCEW